MSILSVKPTLQLRARALMRVGPSVEECRLPTRVAFALISHVPVDRALSDSLIGFSVFSRAA